MITVRYDVHKPVIHSPINCNSFSSKENIFSTTLKK